MSGTCLHCDARTCTSCVREAHMIGAEIWVAIKTEAAEAASASK